MTKRSKRAGSVHRFPYLPDIPTLSKQAMDRLRAVECSSKPGVKAAAKAFGVCPATIYNWRKRYSPHHLWTLEDRSRAPKRRRKVCWTWEHEQRILISHACDIQSKDEKYVEALICKKHDPNDKLLGRWDKNSSSYFVVDPKELHVANASHRIKIEKNALLSMSHDGCAMDDLRQDRFIEWLARRYDRTTVREHFYGQSHKPVYAQFESLSEAKSGPWETFNQAIRDIRIFLPS